MECNLPDLTKEQNIRLQEILLETKLIESEELSPEICKIENSKKNLVLSITPKGGSPIVLKMFSTIKSYENEKKIYTHTKNNEFFSLQFPRPLVYAIPSILNEGLDYIITEHIQGTNIMDLIVHNIQLPWDQELWEHLITDLLQWIIEFSDFYKQVPLDCHVRNFILREKTLYGVDFEDLREANESSLLKVFATLYFSILGAYPGVIEGLELVKKSQIGILLLRRILLSPLFQDKPMNFIITTFLDNLQTEAAIVVQRRINLDRGKGYNMQEIKENLDFVISYIQSDFT
jgi:hypothetical protein